MIFKDKYYWKNLDLQNKRNLLQKLAPNSHKEIKDIAQDPYPEIELANLLKKAI